ncbi:TPA: hypothetical protein U1582_001779 [Streptococcus suis]|uniref:hypothetical protein n=1 Tax=Streptococcus suis TaxID=1307 RepID=UPI0005CEF9F1|nr:hypothetical protein [Streptococcus suis]NQI11133.1 hypothetical protein [Streptococcus suis]NQO00557.1 hypothetical protein [Streptococcus suis]NQO04507.1 hypothetical protein [Streptococcus suis]NQO30559.1 hypothetical protein [Streptococcus suis]NQO69368.1 hypothetical protein [Streptococcus suis]
METHENLTSVTLHARDKEHAHRLVEAIFSDDMETEEVVVPVVEKESFIKRLFMFLVKAVLFLVLTPFFLFTWLKNMFFLGIGLTVSYVILGLLYFSFVDHKGYGFDINSVLFTDTRVTILVIVVVVMGFLSALYDYQEKFEDIMLIG